MKVVRISPVLRTQVSPSEDLLRDVAPAPDEWAPIKREPGEWRAGSQEVSISAKLIDAIIDAARDGLPNEACGLLVADRYLADGGAPARYVPLRNAAESPYRYLIDPDDQLRVWMELDDADEVVWAIVHSHVTSPAEPSATDIGLAFYPDSLYVICSLAALGAPVARGWSIREGLVAEVQLLVV